MFLGKKNHALGLILLFLASFMAHAQDQIEIITYYHNDHTGSPVAASDENGNVLWRKEYSPYGEELNKDPKAAGDRRGFTGHVQDQDLGLVYMQARYYDPILGRFMAIDPMNVNPEASFTFNRYAYANNNPYGYIDPDGEAALTVFNSHRKGLAANDAVKISNFGNSVLEAGATAHAVGSLALGVAEGAYYLAGRAALKAATQTAAPVARVGSTTKNVTEVPLNEIQPLHSVPRPGMPANHIENLAGKIKANGYNINQAVPVMQLPNGIKVSAGGHHRVAAMESLGEKTIPSRVVSWDSLSTKVQDRYLGNKNFGSTLQKHLDE